MRILLINPSCLTESGRDLYSGILVGPLFTLQPSRKMALGIPLALPTLAAMTPPEHSVRILDEEIETINFDEPVDLVGLTAMTFKADRAYEIAAEFRRRGVKVIMGGVHASMCPDEAAAHVDSVVIGEAEELWPRILSDAEAGGLEARYKAEAFPDVRKTPAPRYDLVNTRSYLYSYLQTTRGCPFDCNFCTVTRVNGRRLRKKTPAQVISEVDALLRLNPARQFNVFDRITGRKRRLVGLIAFIDDNFAIDREHALAICAALRQYQEERDVLFFWYTQVNFTVGFDEELLSAMENAGCRHLFIGFENLDPHTLEAMKKPLNKPEQYEQAIRNIEQHHMSVVFSTIIGDDNTSEASASRLRSFIDENHLVHVLLNVLTPFPGTALFEEMEKDDRLLTRQPKLFNIRNVVFRPGKTSAAELQRIYLSLCRQIFEFGQVYRRGKNSIARGDRFFLPLFERLVVLSGLIYTAIRFGIQGRLRWQIAGRVFLAAPRVVLHGSMIALEVLVASVDYDDFAFSEAKRLKTSESNRSDRTGRLIEKTLQKFHVRSNHRNPKRFDAFYIRSQLLEQQGIPITDENKNRPILLLGGTSFPLSARKEFIEVLLEKGFEVASIENPIGGPLDVHIDPVRERPESLRKYLHHLKHTEKVDGIDIVAQSYSAFEVVRVITADPTFSSFVKSVIFINPPGFDQRNNVVKHSCRFLNHLLKGYLVNFWKLFKMKLVATNDVCQSERQFIAREVRGINLWASKTFRNIVRTIRELVDIVRFRVKEPLRAAQEHGYSIYFFLQSDDVIVPARITREEVRDLVPEQNVKVVPGGHTDLFFQNGQRKAFLDFLEAIRGKERRSI